MKDMGMKNKIEIENLVRQIVELHDSTENIMERDIALPKMLRQLYKAVGDPDPADYEGVGKYLYRVSKVSGYTKYPIVISEDKTRWINGDVTYHISRPSETKQRIVENYRSDGWSCDVQAYNVSCDKYMKHKDYDNLWVRFISTRDCSKYEYVFIREN